MAHQENFGAQPDADPRRWLALVVILFAGFMDLLDMTIVNVTIPNILRDLHASYTEAEWVASGYALGFGSVLMITGRLGDVFGRKRLLLIGMAGFTLASALCGVAVDPGMLIATRILQGVMAGTMLPQTLSIIHVTFAPEERGKAYGLFGGIVGCASAVGLVAGGLLVQWNLFGLEWRPVFLVNVPVGLAALVAGWFVISEAAAPVARKLDLVGAVLALGTTVLLVFALTEGRDLGWLGWTFLLLAAAVVLLVVLVRYERRRARTVGSPLVVLSLFRARSFSSGSALLLIFSISFAGFFFAWSLYMQVGLGWTPIHAGLTAVAFALSAMIGSGVSMVALTPKFGRRVLMAGALANAAGFAGYSVLAAHYGPAIHSWQVLAPLVVAGGGFGLVVAPIIDLILTDVPVSDAGAGAGLLSSVQETGMALGVAVVGLVFFAYLDPGVVHNIDAAALGLRTGAADPATARSFAHAFSRSLWFPIGFLGVFFLGLFALPHQFKPRDIDAEMDAAPVEEEGQLASR
jgi:EmrB/QacA subfamily drug resistance transporter